MKILKYIVAILLALALGFHAYAEARGMKVVDSLKSKIAGNSYEKMHDGISQITCYSLMNGSIPVSISCVNDSK